MAQYAGFSLHAGIGVEAEQRNKLERLAARAEAFERIPLFRLAWDACLSAFASRQVLYERFFFGDPVRTAGALVTSHDAEIRELASRVRELVREPSV